MHISSIILRVADLAVARGFWVETVGLTPIRESPNFSFLDGGGVQLALNVLDLELEDSSLTEIVFEVEHVRDRYEVMRDRGVPFEVDLRPVDVDGSRQLLAAHFHDPDGHLVSLTGWVDAPV